MSKTVQPREGSIQGGYDRWAVIYDHEANPLSALEEPLMRETIGDVQGLKVLDLGCGTGRHSTWLAASGATVTGVDFSEGMLAAARNRPEADAIRFLVHDLHQPLPFADDEFDLVVSGLVLEHLQDLPGFFGETKRVLKPDGRAVISAMHPAMFLLGSQARFTDPESGSIVHPGSFPHSLGEFVMAAVTAGFQLEGIGEYEADARFTEKYPRIEKYLGWPMLVILNLETATR